MQERQHCFYVLVAPGTILETSVAIHYFRRKQSLYFPKELGKDLPQRGDI